MPHYAVFFPQTGAVRVFESYNLAQATYPRQSILVGPDSVPADKALTWYEQLFEYLDAEGKHFVHGDSYVTSNEGRKTFPKIRTAETWDANGIRQAFWELAVTCGNRVTKYAPNNETGKRGKKVTGYHIDLTRANEVLADTETLLPDQAKAIIRFLTEQEFDYYTRDEMIKTCNGVKFIQAVKTRQEPWRIWRYYAKTLSTPGLIK